MKNYKYYKGSAAARDVLEQNGFDSLLDFPLELFASGLGATVIKKPLLNSDGRIIFGKKHTIIEINENIEFEQKKRFTLAHEIGHFILLAKEKLIEYNELKGSFQVSD
ncbi:ImmA/IrrE family metallo-endopeptidase [Muricauda sp. SCSIO 64092]|uniref:ImmA/IrrE family metallo-endopeptidase n=1 Tax=Allomuricauda sp. SCSIO 64092 TaxID=2908842 RepID=UPI001FF0F41F|nr:ImmA/IrrE family metallo-endopeptidase [Muricauda sp. SCSIO 64092]UOY05736.1 ImmA/IrrE family metallo-endopeptidase [Muricauda sp. SCSIO 64092]